MNQYSLNSTRKSTNLKGMEMNHGSGLSYRDQSGKLEGIEQTSFLISAQGYPEWIYKNVVLRIIVHCSCVMASGLWPKATSAKILVTFKRKCKNRFIIKMKFIFFDWFCKVDRWQICLMFNASHLFISILIIIITMMRLLRLPPWIIRNKRWNFAMHSIKSNYHMFILKKKNKSQSKALFNNC